MHSVVQQNVFAACEEMRSTVSVVDRRESVVCPKPRRIGLSVPDPVRPLRWHVSYQAELCESKAGMELLDIILTKGSDHGPSPAASSPPYFCGSPPSRSANPLVRDVRFGEAKQAGVPAQPNPYGVASSPSASSSTWKGCARTKFGLKPAAVCGSSCTQDSKSGSICTRHFTAGSDCKRAAKLIPSEADLVGSSGGKVDAVD